MQAELTLCTHPDGADGLKAALRHRSEMGAIYSAAEDARRARGGPWSDVQAAHDALDAAREAVHRFSRCPDCGRWRETE